MREPDRYYVQPSTIGWQVRDRKVHRVVEWEGGWAIFPKQADANSKAKQLNRDSVQELSTDKTG